MGRSGERRRPRAYAAIRQLQRTPEQVVKLLAGRLRPAVVKEQTQKRIDRLIADLAGEPPIRDQASKELLGFGREAVPGLKKAAGEAVSREVRRRAKVALAELTRMPVAADTLRQIRAIEVLEG